MPEPTLAAKPSLAQRLLGPLALLGACFSLVGGCSSDPEDDADICQTSKDCPAGQRCIMVASGAEGSRSACKLVAEETCVFNTDCETPLVCAVDHQCRNECLADRDCTGIQLCVHGVCADPDEVTADGALKGAVEGAMGPGAAAGG